MRADSMATQIRCQPPRERDAVVVLPDGRLASNIRIRAGRLETVDGVTRFVEDPAGHAMGMMLTVRGPGRSDVLPD